VRFFVPIASGLKNDNITWDFHNWKNSSKGLKLGNTRGTIMENEILFLVEEAPEGGYQAKALGHCIFTEAGTFEELKAMVQDAVHCHFEPEEKPPVIRLHVVKDEVIAT
jgi:hypothetical protein